MPIIPGCQNEARVFEPIFNDACKPGGGRSHLCVDLATTDTAPRTAGCRPESMRLHENLSSQVAVQIFNSEDNVSPQDEEAADAIRPQIDGAPLVNMEQMVLSIAFLAATRGVQKSLPS